MSLEKAISLILEKRISKIIAKKIRLQLQPDKFHKSYFTTEQVALLFSYRILPV